MHVLPLGSNAPLSGAFIPRDYQEAGIVSGLRFMNSDKGENELQVVPCGGGKSVLIAGICERFTGNILVLQPSQEILRQNYSKFISYGGHAGIFSASVGRKDLARVTFASIQSVMSRKKAGVDKDGNEKFSYNSASHFLHFRHIIIDEVHLGSSAGDSQLSDFLDMLEAHHGKKPRVLGFTATPFRMSRCTDRHGNSDSMLKFLTRTRPRILGKLSYWVQIAELKDRGFLCKTEYYSVTKELGFNRNAIKVNSTGADYDEDSLRQYYDTIDFKEDVVNLVRRINKKGKRVLAFCSFVADAEYISAQLGNSATVHALTPRHERLRIEEAFKRGDLMSVINCSTWTVGYDDPSLDCVMLAKPMRSLSLFYQMLSRGLRIDPKNPDKRAWFVDCCGNMQVFGKVEELVVSHDVKGLPVILGSGGKLLTGVPLKEQEVKMDLSVMS